MPALRGGTRCRGIPQQLSRQLARHTDRCISSHTPIGRRRILPPAGKTFCRTACFAQRQPALLRQRDGRIPDAVRNTQHLAYLPDVARLEWAYHRAYFADDVPSFDLTRLANIAPDSYAGCVGNCTRAARCSRPLTPSRQSGRHTWTVQVPISTSTSSPAATACWYIAET